MVIRKKAEGGEYQDNDSYVHIYVFICVCLDIVFCLFIYACKWRS